MQGRNNVNRRRLYPDYAIWVVLKTRSLLSWLFSIINTILPRSSQMTGRWLEHCTARIPLGFIAAQFLLFMVSLRVSAENVICYNCNCDKRNGSPTSTREMKVRFFAVANSEATLMLCFRNFILG